MKKIAFFMHNFNGGGAERVTITLAEQLANKGYAISIIVKNNIGKLKATVPNTIDVIDLNLISKSKIINNINNIYELSKIINSEQFDLVISVTSPMNLVAAISNAIVRKKTRLYCTVHNAISQEKKKFNWIRHKMLKVLDKYVEKTIVVSEDSRLDYIKTIGINENKTITIYNPVISKEIFTKMKEDISHKWLRDNRQFKTIVSAGRLTKQKNYDLLLRSIAIVRESIDIKVIILGEGELKQELQQLSHNLGIEDIVDFVGFVNNSYAYFEKADLYVLSSLWEGLPTVLIEALACGCRIVSTNCKTGPSEILNNGEYGILVDGFDEKEFSKNIIKAFDINTNKEDLIQRSKEYSIEKSVSEYINKIIEIEV